MGTRRKGTKIGKKQWTSGTKNRKEGRNMILFTSCEGPSLDSVWHFPTVSQQTIIFWRETDGSRGTVGLSVKISSCKHLQKIFENWFVMRKSISRQQSLSFIDYIYLNKSKSYAGHMQVKLKQRKIILENFAALIVFSLKQREITQVNQQSTKG